MLFLASGALGKFDFQTMLVQLVSALGLLSVATLVVEMCMLYCFPHRKYYNKYKVPVAPCGPGPASLALHPTSMQFEETIDFSDVRDAENLGDR